MKKDPEVEKKIELFIKAVKSKIPAIRNIIYEYNDSVQSYLIWHDLVPNEEDKYHKELGILIYDYLFKNGIYDISFAYSSEKFSKKNIGQNDNTFLIEHNTNIKYSFLKESVQPMSITIENGNSFISFIIKNDIIVSNSQRDIESQNISTKVLFDDLLLKATLHEQCKNCGQEGLAA